MYLRRLTLHNFRVYESLQLDLQAGLTVFVGPNAAGKTSLLEAMYLLAATKSPRTNSDCELVRWGADVARVEGLFVTRRERELRLAVGLDPSCAVGANPKRLEVEGEVVPTAAQMIGHAQVVMFAPDDLAIIKGGPGLRRRFLNTALAQLQPRYLDDLTRYRRALRQRNELLKTLGRAGGTPALRGSGGLGELEAWTEQLVQSGAAVALARQRFVVALSQHAGEVHHLIGAEETLSLQYHGELAEAPDEAAAGAHFRQRLADLGDLEVRRGTTLVGPHRDELQVSVNGASLRNTAHRASSARRPSASSWGRPA